MSKKVLGVFREERFSNHAVSEDRAILESSLKRLEDQVWVSRVSEERIGELNSDLLEYDLILSMAQSDEALVRLEYAEKAGRIVMNSPSAIRGCYRLPLSKKLATASFGYPAFHLYTTDEKPREVPFESENGYWIKRGDYHALSDEDVVFRQDLDGIQEALVNFRDRGVQMVLVQKHILGPVLKVYGARNGFFEHRWMDQPFRNEPLYQGEVPADFNRIKSLALEAGAFMNLDIFGGDFVLTPKGEACLIDMNDWPSFRNCREAAADAIASFALSKMNLLS